MKKKAKNALKSCPFCHERANFVETEGAVWVECSRCEATSGRVYRNWTRIGKEDLRKLAADRWNSRGGALMMRCDRCGWKMLDQFKRGKP